MSRSLLACSASAFVRALQHHAPHRGYLRTLSTYGNSCDSFSCFKDATLGRLKNPLDERCFATKSGDKGGSRETEKTQDSLQSTSSVKQQSSKHVFHHLPHQRSVPNLSPCNEDCELICQTKDSSSATNKLSYEIYDTKREDGKKLQCKALENTQKSTRSLSLVKQGPQTGDDLQHLKHQSSTPNLSMSSDKCGLSNEINAAKEKFREKFQNKALEQTQQQSRSPSHVKQSPQTEHDLQYVPQKSSVINLSTCGEKCEQFCRWKDSYSTSVTMPNESFAAKKAVGDKMQRKALAKPSKPPRCASQAKEHQTEHEHTYLPHDDSAGNLTTCGNNLRLLCHKDPTSGGFNSQTDETHRLKKEDDVKGGRVPESTKHPAKYPSHAIQQPQIEQEHQHLPHLGAVCDIFTCRDKCRLFCRLNDSLSVRRSSKQMEKVSAYKKSIDTEKSRGSEHQQSAGPPCQTQQTMQTKCVMSRNLSGRSTSVSALRQSHSFGGWDQPPNQLRIALQAKKSESAPGGKKPDTPGATSPGKPDSKASDKPGGEAPDKAPQKSEDPGAMKKKFSKHVQMILGYTDASKKPMPQEKKKEPEKPQGKEGPKNSSSGSIPAKGGKK